MTDQIKKLAGDLKNYRITYFAETDNFPKYIVVYEYMEFLNSLPAVCDILKEAKAKSEEKIELVKEKKYLKFLFSFSVKGNVFSKNAWIFYATLKIIHEALTDYKTFSEDKAKEIEEKLDDTMKGAWSRIHIGIAMIWINKVIIDQLCKRAFKNNQLKLVIAKIDLAKQYVDYEYDQINEKGTLAIGESCKITFDGMRALIVYYFFELRKLDAGFKTYKNFNDKMKTDISSRIFRQDIKEINERIKNYSKGWVRELIIIREEKSKDKEVNYYKWDIKT